MDYKFYKLTKHTITIFVGMTTQRYLSDRLRNHKISYQNWKNGTQKKMLYFPEDFVFEDIEIELIESHFFESIDDAREKENQLIQQLNPNQKVKNDPNYHKEYNKNNREKISIRKAEYFQEVTKEKGRNKVMCERCDAIVSKSSKWRHDKECNTNFMIHDDTKKFVVRKFGKNARQIGRYETLQEAKKVRKMYQTRQLHKLQTKANNSAPSEAIPASAAAPAPASASDDKAALSPAPA